jgi:hypothetical protein
MGTKTALNEFVAYLDLAKLPEGAPGPRARLIVTYALCGFANFARNFGQGSARWFPAPRRSRLGPLDRVRHDRDLHERGGGGLT